MAATHPTCHKCKHPGAYFLECGGWRVYITDTGQAGAKKWLAKAASISISPRYFRRLTDAKSWAHDVLAEHA